MTWSEIRSRLDGGRAEVYEAMQRLGANTTRDLAVKMGRDILSVRPRVTELYHLGMARLRGRQRCGSAWEGVYEAVDLAEAEANHRKLTGSLHGQMLLGV